MTFLKATGHEPRILPVTDEAPAAAGRIENPAKTAIYFASHAMEPGYRKNFARTDVTILEGNGARRRPRAI